MPAAKTPAGTGLASSGSREPRSRSPAVASMASVIPPRSGARIPNIGMRKRRTAPRWRGVAVFTRSIFTDSLREGLTPRAMSRRVAVSRLKAARSRSACRVAGPDSVRESS